MLGTISRHDVLELAHKLATDFCESLTLTAFRRKAGLSEWLNASW